MEEKYIQFIDFFIYKIDNVIYVISLFLNLLRLLFKS